MIRFAAIVPLHNKGREVAQAIDSILAQRLPASEIIIVDDASVDDGPAIVRSYADPRIRLLHRVEAGAGGYAARNLAIAESTAEWCAFLDADDAWHPDHLEAFSALVTSHPAAGCVATRYTHVFRNHQEPDRVARSISGNQAIILGFAEYLTAWLEAEHCPLWTGALAIRRDVFDRSGLFPAGRAQRGGDKDLWLRVSLVTDIAFLPRSTADFRREADNKLTDRIDTRELPCLVATANTLAAAAKGSERRLLHRLINQEIKLYARWTARSGRRSRLRLRDLHWPASLSAICTVARRAWCRWIADPIVSSAAGAATDEVGTVRAVVGRRHIAVIGMRGLNGVIGGIETHCAALYPDLAAMMPEVRFTLLARRSYVAGRRSDFAGMEVRGLWSPRHRSTETLVHSLIAVLHARFRLNADVVHLHGIGPGFFAALGRLLGMRVIVTSHAPDYRRPKWGLFGRTFLRLGESMAARWANRLICVSETVRRDLVARFPRSARSLVTIRHGVCLTPLPAAAGAALLHDLALRPGAYLLAVSRFDATNDWRT